MRASRSDRLRRPGQPGAAAAAGPPRRPRRRSAAAIRYILVDEFQDTNHAQFELVKLLAGSAKANVTVVGDDDQSIYRFRGAALSNILGFRAGIPPCRQRGAERQLPQPAADPGRGAIGSSSTTTRTGSNRARGWTSVWSARSRFDRLAPAEGPIQLLAFDTGSDEADALAERIAASLRAGRRPGDHAILVRTNRDADPLLRALNMARVPWRFSGTAGLYQQPEVRLLVSFLRAVERSRATRSAATTWRPRRSSAWRRVT